MMEIKVRAWDKDNKEMLYKNFWDRNWYTTPKNDKGGCHCVCALSADQRSYMDVMLWTGRTDKNNKEVYRQDIVEWNKKIWVVSWNDKMSRYFMQTIDSFNDKKEKRSFGEWGFMKERIEIYTEIIGNVFMNPELLKIKL